MNKRFTLLFGSLIFSGLVLQAQELFNNGSTIQINGIVVFVNGGIENNSAGTIVNDGNFWSTNNGIAPGSLTLNGASSTSGTGKFYVEQDFVNNANWNGAGNEVIMNSNAANQNITGISATSFSHLTLTPSTAAYPDPKVLMGINVTVTDSLWLNNREMATQTNTLTVTSATNGAITNNSTQGSEGFISSVAPGYTEWQTGSGSTYFFPVGSSNGTLRYRPVEITPNAGGSNTYTVRFNNNNAGTDGFNTSLTDSTFCNLNPNWYHSITRAAGTSTSDIAIYFDAAADGNWDGIAQWQTSQWNNMQPTTAGASGYLSSHTKAAWPYPDPSHPYALIENAPAPPVISCPPPVCSNATNTLFTASGSASGNYVWTLPDSSVVAAGDSLSLNFQWPTGSTVAVVAANASNTCFSTPVICSVSVVQAPTAAYSAAENPNNQLDYTFTDISTGSVQPSVWEIDGVTYTGPTPSVVFGGPGTYTLTLLVNNSGCYDTVSGTIVVDYIDELVIPNVFSPNGDGINDDFFLTHSGFKDFRFTLFNRWGQVIFNADAPSFHWDGKDTNGDIVSDGTYYYFVKGTNLAGKEVEKEGYLMVFKKK